MEPEALRQLSQHHRHRESRVAPRQGTRARGHTLWDVGELHGGGMQGAARRSRCAMTTTAVCRRSMASSLSCGRTRYLRKLSLGLSGPDSSWEGSTGTSGSARRRHRTRTVAVHRHHPAPSPARSSATPGTAAPHPKGPGTRSSFAGTQCGPQPASGPEPNPLLVPSPSTCRRRAGAAGTAPPLSLRAERPRSRPLVIQDRAAFPWNGYG